MIAQTETEIAATQAKERQEALCIAPATQTGSASSVYCACHARLCVCVRLAARQKAAAGQRRPPRSVYCACHAQGKCGGSEYCACQAKGRRGPAAATAPQLLQKPLCTAPATQKGSAEALCTAPATQKAVAGQRRPPRRSSPRKLYVLRLPRKREVRRL